MSTETTSVPAIDMSAIMQLADNDDTGDQFVAEIIKVFLNDLSERVLTMGLQMKQGDRAGVAATAHAIKGSCGHFGALRLMELSRDLEDQAKCQPAGDIEVAILTMVAETERVRTALEAFRSANASPG
ncbi:Hpt domain-containing protein [Candidatus Binatus sp.]|uniref:Hpt domain-containing protein n=1 Tax=Candidatus Binatus sp. TaxID=2811406 RepID=UPI003BAF03A2